MDRRDFLKWTGFALAGTIIPGAAWASTGIGRPFERWISLRNLHTGEKLREVYWAEGRYLPEALRAVDRVLRDHRTNEVHPMDRALLDHLHTLAEQFSVTDPVQIISGFRSAHTNDALRKGGHRVARKSFHLTGQAVDLRIPGVAHDQLLRAARRLRAGGVGDYPGQDFVHLDTGPVRTW